MLVLTAANLSASQGIAHGFFGRKGGVSEGVYASLNCGPGSGDERARVLENRRRALARIAGDANAKLLTLYQIHSDHVATVGHAWEIGDAPEADAMVTKVPGLALGILTADCAPVLLADEDAGVIGAAHAGWKGALAGVIGNVVGAIERLGARREHIRAAIGPLISQPNYEVGPEFRTRFLEGDSRNLRFFVPAPREQHWLFDLEGFIAEKLVDAGVREVERISACTYARTADFFSFRRTTHRGEPDYGRGISFILLKN